jgi:hypothetical protein
MITVAKTLGIANWKVKTTTFSSIVVLKELVPHIDDKYGIDVDETHRVNDLLDLQYKQNMQ